MNARKLEIRTKAGRITRYGFACGYVDELTADTRIEGLPYGRGLLARDRSGHRVLYVGPSLTAARKACRDANKGAAP